MYRFARAIGFSLGDYMQISKLKFVGVCLFAVAATTVNGAPSDDECKAAWERADINKDGFVSGGEMTPYLIAVKKDGRHNEVVRDGKLDQDEFMKVCKDGIFEGIKLQVWDARRNEQRKPWTSVGE